MVFVVQEVPGRDVLSANKFGQIKLLLPPGDVVLSTVPTLNRLRKSLREFSDADYLLLMGCPVAIGMATMVAQEANRGVVKMLKWDRRNFCYYEVIVDMHSRLLDPSSSLKAVAA